MLAVNDDRRLEHWFEAVRQEGVVEGYFTWVIVNSWGVDKWDVREYEDVVDKAILISYPSASVPGFEDYFRS